MSLPELGLSVARRVSTVLRLIRSGKGSLVIEKSSLELEKFLDKCFMFHCQQTNDRREDWDRHRRAGAFPKGGGADSQTSARRGKRPHQSRREGVPPRENRPPPGRGRRASRRVPGPVPIPVRAGKPPPRLGPRPPTVSHEVCR